MPQSEMPAPMPVALDYDTTIIGALELSDNKWVLAVQLPGVKRHTRHVLGANGEELALLIERLKARCAASGHPITRVILTHEAGRDGFWLARFLVRRDVEVHVMQSSSLPVDRRARRAKTDVIDVDMLLRTLMALLRGEPRVCSMVPIPDEAHEEARRAGASRTGGFDRRTGIDREQDRRHPRDAGCKRISGLTARSSRATGSVAATGWCSYPTSSAGSNRTSARSARACCAAGQRGGGGARRGSEKAGAGR
jgi:hypothetical protein